MDELQKGEILIYQTESVDTKIDVFLEDGTVLITTTISHPSIATLLKRKN